MSVRRPVRSVSILIPVYNERDNVASVIDAVFDASLGRDGVAREVIVINDGSTDGTRELLDALPPRDGLRIHHQPQNGGKGTAVRQGFALATGDVVMIQDADLEYDPADYVNLLEPIFDGRTPVVYGSRFMGQMERMDPWHVLGNKILTLVSNLLFGGNLTDIYTCYKVMRREVLSGVRLRSRGFELEAEITAKIRKRGYHIMDVPIRFKGRTVEEGKKIRKLDGFKGVLYLIKYRFVD